MNSNSERVDLFNFPDFEEDIAARMDKLDKLKNKVPEKNNGEDLKFVDRLFFKRVLKDITDIELLDNGTLNVYFDRGVNLVIDTNDSTESHNESISESISNYSYRVIKIIGELIELGEIKLRTSPFLISMNKNKLVAVYRQSLDEELHKHNEIKNIHDLGLNCWGGWGGHVRSNYDDLNLEQSLILMTQRMRQLNIDDIAGDEDRMSYLISQVYRDKALSINPVILARLIIEYDLDRYVLKNNEYNQGGYFSRVFDPDLNTQINRVSLLNNIKTDIPYNTFMELLEKFSIECRGMPSPKIKRK